MANTVRDDAMTADTSEGNRYEGERQRYVALPLGGVGAGQIALGADGGLRQWQMMNQINHVGYVPDSFFAIRTSCTEPPLNETRILQSREILTRSEEPTPLVNDDYIPPQQKALLQQFSGVERTVFTGAYPFANIEYFDKALPLDVALEAYSPFIPLDAQASGLPAIIFTFTLHNRWSHEIHGGLGATLQNAVGWDGITPITGYQSPLYGGNTNRLHEMGDFTALVMENLSLSEDHPGWGQMALVTPQSHVLAYEQWTQPEQFIQFMNGANPNHQVLLQPVNRQRSYRNTAVVAGGPSPAGTTWNGGLFVPFSLEPGETTTVTFIVSWYFPNRYVNFDQFGPQHDYGRSRFWLGNAYATRFADALHVARFILEQRERLETTSRAWVQGIYGSTLPAWMKEAIAAQGSLIRSPTSFWTEDGRFYGFEGSLGASTAMWNGAFGGSCPLNCTHVWNYEQALSHLFPELERSMRETDLGRVQAPEGYIPHRTILPLYLSQLWGVHIGGPTNPALDGMLGTVLKTYREVRQGAGEDWLRTYWPHIERLMSYIIEKWDAERDGVLEGEQPNTYDIAFYGPNMYIGGLWLAALRAAEELAKRQGNEERAAEYRELFERGSKKYDELLWNGEYYIQLIDEHTPPEDQFGEGCLADQLFGQWWAHLLDLGYLLPVEHVRTTLRSIVSYNLRVGFRDFVHGYRIFADRDDTGLLVCTWPHGGRPEIPVRYCDEVWTGIEYQVGAHCLMEGMVDEGLRVLSALRARYNGAHRNPYNEIECGDHYARAMAGWSIVEAIGGVRYDASRGSVIFQPVGQQQEFAVPFISGTGWGTIARRATSDGWQIELCCTYGQLEVERLELDIAANGKQVEARIGDRDCAVDTITTDGTCELCFAQSQEIPAGRSLFVSIAA